MRQPYEAGRGGGLGAAAYRPACFNRLVSIWSLGALTFGFLVGGMLRRTFSLCTLVAASLVLAPLVEAAPPSATQERANRLLLLVNSAYKSLITVENNAQWNALTDVTPAHDAANEAASKARAAFAGDPVLINETKALLQKRSELDDLTIRELEQMLLNAAEGPMTNPKLVADRIAAEVAQASTLKLFGDAKSAESLDGLKASEAALKEELGIQ